MNWEFLEQMADRRSTAEAYRELCPESRAVLRKELRGRGRDQKESAIWRAWYDEKAWEYDVRYVSEYSD